MVNTDTLFLALQFDLKNMYFFTVIYTLWIKILYPYQTSEIRNTLITYVNTI